MQGLRECPKNAALFVNLAPKIGPGPLTKAPALATLCHRIHDMPNDIPAETLGIFQITEAISQLLKDCWAFLSYQALSRKVKRFANGFSCQIGEKTDWT